MLLLGGSPRNNWAEQTRHALVAPRRCPGLRYAEKLYQSHAYITKVDPSQAVVASLDNGSPSVSALQSFTKTHCWECFRIDLIRQDKQIQSDIRKSLSAYREDAPEVMRRGDVQKATLRDSFPQTKSSFSKDRRAWLSSVRLANQPRKKVLKSGRGSTSRCRSRGTGCSMGQAQLLKPEMRDAIVQRFGQQTALCRACQRRFMELLSRNSPRFPDPKRSGGPLHVINWFVMPCARIPVPHCTSHGLFSWFSYLTSVCPCACCLTI